MVVVVGADDADDPLVPELVGEHETEPGGLVGRYLAVAGDGVEIEPDEAVPGDAAGASQGERHDVEFGFVEVAKPRLVGGQGLSRDVEDRLAEARNGEVGRQGEADLDAGDIGGKGDQLVVRTVRQEREGELTPQPGFDDGRRQAGRPVDDLAARGARAQHAVPGGGREVEPVGGAFGEGRVAERGRRIEVDVVRGVAAGEDRVPVGELPAA